MDMWILFPLVVTRLLGLFRPRLTWVLGVGQELLLGSAPPVRCSASTSSTNYELEFSNTLRPLYVGYILGCVMGGYIWGMYLSCEYCLCVWYTPWHV